MFFFRYVPTEGAIDTAGLNVSPQIMKELFKIEPSEWQSGILINSKLRREKKGVGRKKL